MLDDDAGSGGAVCGTVGCAAVVPPVRPLSPRSVLPACGIPAGAAHRPVVGVVIIIIITTALFFFFCEKAVDGD